MASSEDYNCPICLDLLLEPVVGACGHEFCRDCYGQWLSRSRTYPSCPLCRVPLSMSIPGKPQVVKKRTKLTQGSFQACSAAVGVSRRLADLIEASFPDKTRHRRYALTLQPSQVDGACVLLCNDLLHCCSNAREQDKMTKSEADWSAGSLCVLLCSLHLSFMWCTSFITT